MTPNAKAEVMMEAAEAKEGKAAMEHSRKIKAKRRKAREEIHI